ncbi:MAG: hypothetical protein HUU50_16795 [Candidatus Brocadiae bacterium]|nr:hypothetical protein [Candidatus Brocadiia bacterium]
MQRILYIFVIILPLLLTCIFFYAYFDKTLLECQILENDEMLYWHEVLTFTKVGFSGGYYSFGDELAPFVWSNWDMHGPCYPVLYGILALVFGWHPYSPILFNLALLSLSLALFLYLIKPNIKQTIMVGLTLSTFWPLMLFLPWTNQESMNISISFFLTFIFYKIFKEKENITPRFQSLSLLFLCIASFIRITWVILIPPFCIMVLRKKSLKKISFAFLMSIFLSLFLVYLFSGFSAPHPDIIMNIIEKIPTWDGKLLFLAENAKINLNRLFSFIEDTPLETLLRYQVLLILAILAISLLLDLGKNSRLLLTWFKEEYFHLYQLFTILFLNLVFWNILVWRDYRIIAPHLLVSVLLIILLGNPKKTLLAIPFLVLLTHLFFFSDFSNIYKDLHGRRFDKSHIAAKEAFSEMLKDVVVYQKNAHSRWCNTIAYPGPIHPWLAGAPAGIGFSFIAIDKPMLKAKYIFTVSPVSSPHFKLLKSESLGYIYQNLLSECKE